MKLHVKWVIELDLELIAVAMEPVESDNYNHGDNGFKVIQYSIQFFYLSYFAHD